MTMFDFKDCYKSISSVAHREMINEVSPETALTICIPTFKRDRLLEHAVSSIWNQTELINVEILIIDNDFERVTIPSFLKNKSNNVRYIINHENIGMFGNWNKAILESRSSNLIILCDDDWLDENYFKEIKKYLKEKKAVMGLHSYYDKRQNKKKKLTLKSMVGWCFKKIRPKIQEITTLDYFFEPLSPLIMFNRDSLIKIGGFDNDYFPGSDVVLYAKYVKLNGGILIKKNFSFFRIEENESRKPETALKFPEINRKLREEISKNYRGIDLLIPCAYEYDRIEIAKTWNLVGINESRTVKYWIYALSRVLRELLILSRLWRKISENINTHSS